MFTTFAHLGHDHSNSYHEAGTASGLDPYGLLIPSGLVIISLLLFILYFLIAWQPKGKPTSKPKTTNAKSSKKPVRKTK